MNAHAPEPTPVPIDDPGQIPKPEPETPVIPPDPAHPGMPPVREPPDVPTPGKRKLACRLARQVFRARGRIYAARRRLEPLAPR